MRVGVVADVHSNLPALRAALGLLDAAGIDRLGCAGDLVGYGPHPNECVAMLAEAGAVCVAGNHDLIALGRLAPDRCVPVARQTLRWTAGQLAPSSREFLEGLPAQATIGELVLAHGSLGDPEAPTRTEQVAGVLAAVEREHPAARALVLGHTHEPAVWDATGQPLPHRGTVALPAGRGVLNPGAVGQTRARLLREPRVLARCLVVDLAAETATFLATPYPLWPLRRALRDAGLPPWTYRLATPLPRAVATRLRRA